MYVCTIIVENDKGESRPLTFEANKKWYQEEYLRMLERKI